MVLWLYLEHWGILSTRMLKARDQLNNLYLRNQNSSSRFYLFIILVFKLIYSYFLLSLIFSSLIIIFFFPPFFYSFIFLSFYPFLISSFYPLILSSFHLFILSSFHSFFLSSFHLFIFLRILSTAFILLFLFIISSFIYNKALRSSLFSYSWPNGWTKLADILFREPIAISGVILICFPRPMPSTSASYI